MIVRQVYVYAFYARASPSYADCRRLTDGKVDARTLAAEILARRRAQLY